MYRFLFLCLLFGALFGCSPDTDVSGITSGPSLLDGRYVLVSARDKAGTTFGRSGVTIPADEPTFVEAAGAEARFLITGTLTFTGDRYEVVISMDFIGSGGTHQALTRTDRGFHNITGTDIRLTSDVAEIGSEIGTIHDGGLSVHIDTRDLFFVFEKR